MEDSGMGDGEWRQPPKEERTGCPGEVGALGVEGAVGVCPEDKGEGHFVKGKPTDFSL